MTMATSEYMGYSAPDQDFAITNEEENGIEMFEKIECSSFEEDLLERDINISASALEQMHQDIFICEFSTTCSQDLNDTAAEITTVSTPRKRSGGKKKRKTIRRFSKISKKSRKVNTNADTTNARAKQASKFNCTTCTETFASQSALIKHMYFHIDKYGGNCPCCGKWFTQQINMQTHYKAVHEKIKYTCGVCTAKLSSVANLIHHHQNLHSGKWVQCTKCETWVK